jgi:hypothetical protein
MVWPGGLGMLVATTKFVGFVNRPLKVWHRVSNILETNVLWSLGNAGMPFIFR